LSLRTTATSEAAGISRVTLHRIEKGKPSVSMAAYCKVMTALGMELCVIPSGSLGRDTDTGKPSIPVRIMLQDYPQLQQLAWQLHGVDSLKPLEALGVYERNRRHLDFQVMDPKERDLINALKTGLGNGGEQAAGQLGSLAGR
jgi:transcriptional regulator with XRE-family HTH domain